MDIHEVFDDKMLGRNISTIRLKLPTYATKLIFMGDVDGFRKN
ncbi:MAG: hypothetical protein QXT26_03610 [Thermoproteota archaeon]